MPACAALPAHHPLPTRRSSDLIAKLAWSYAPQLSDRQVKEVVGRVRALAPRRERTVDPDLIPVGNGVFNYRTKKLMPFSPDRSEEHTSELQSRFDLVCRLLLEK